MVVHTFIICKAVPDNKQTTTGDVDDTSLVTSPESTRLL